VVVVKAHYEHCSTSPACAVLTESRDQDCVKVIADYAGLLSTRENTKVVAPMKFELQTHPWCAANNMWPWVLCWGSKIPDSAFNSYRNRESSMIIGLTIGYQLYQPKLSYQLLTMLQNVRTATKILL